MEPDTEFTRTLSDRLDRHTVHHDDQLGRLARLERLLKIVLLAQLLKVLEVLLAHFSAVR